MKATEHKFKQTMPFAAVPGFLRHLADAIEKRSHPVPAERSDLPAPFSKLSVKGKRRDDHWEMKVKLKAEGPSALSGVDAAGAQAESAQTAGGKPGIKYKDLKKRMKASFKAIGEAIANQRMPEQDTLKAFLTDAEHMTAFPGSEYGEDYYPDYREACQKLARACKTKDLEAVRTSYALLDQLKNDCHKLYK